MKKLIVTLLIMFLSCGAWSQIVSTAEMREMYRNRDERRDIQKPDVFLHGSYDKRGHKMTYRIESRIAPTIRGIDLAMGLRTKEYPDATHYWSVARVMTHTKRYGVRGWHSFCEERYLLLDSIGGVERNRYCAINATKKKIKKFGVISYAGNMSANVFLLGEAEYRWGCFLSPWAYTVHISNGIIENYKESRAQESDDMGALWRYTIMDGRWPDHINRALEKMADIVNKSDVDYSSCPQHGNHTIILTYDADTVSAAEMLDGSQNNELLNRLNKALQDVPRKPFPYLYTLDGRRLAGIIVEAVFADSKWAFSLKE